MAAKKRKTRKDRREDIREGDIVGLKYFGMLTPLLERLRQDTTFTHFSTTSPSTPNTDRR